MLFRKIVRNQSKGGYKDETRVNQYFKGERHQSILSTFEPTFSGLPCSALAMSGGAQMMLFRQELVEISNNSRTKIELYHNWNIWTVGVDKKVSIDRCIQTEKDVHSLFGSTILDCLARDHKVHLLRQGIIPVKKTLGKGSTIEIKISHKEEASFIVQTILCILTNRIYHYSRTLHIAICGITIRRLERYSIFSLWIHPIQNFGMDTNDYFVQENVANLLSILRSLLSEELSSCLSKIIVMKNSDSSTVFINS